MLKGCDKIAAIAAQKSSLLRVCDIYIWLFRIFPLSLVTDEKPWAISDAYAAMLTDEARNRIIVSDVLDASRSGRTPIVLTERYDHAKVLAGLLQEHCKNVVLLSGKGSA